MLKKQFAEQNTNPRTVFCTGGPIIIAFSAFHLHLSSKLNSPLNFDGDFFGERPAIVNSAGMVSMLSMI